MLLIQPDDTLISLFKASVYSRSWVRNLVNGLTYMVDWTFKTRYICVFFVFLLLTPTPTPTPALLPANLFLLLMFYRV